MVKFPLKNLAGGVIGVGGIATDITSLRRLEQDRARLNDLYATLSQANKAIVRCRSEQELMREICRVCVEFGHFDLAWIGAEQGGVVVPTASFGPCSKYLDGIEILAGADAPLGRGPTGTALREQRTVLCHDWATDPMIEPWRKRGAAFGFQSSAAFPILLEGQTAGVLTIYSRLPNYFQPDRLALMEELADDVAYALGRFKEERQRRKAETSLREERARYEDLVNTQPAGIYRILFTPGAPAEGAEWEPSLGGRYQVEFVSDRFCDILGVTREAFTADHTLLHRRLHPEDLEGFLELRAKVVGDLQRLRWEGRLSGPPDPPRWVRLESSPRMLEDGRTLWTGILVDITEQRAARELLDRQHAVLTAIQESTDGPIFSVDRAYRYTGFNQAHARVMKALYGSDIALGLTLRDCQTAPGDWKLAQANLDRALAGEQVIEEAFSGEEGPNPRCFLVSHNPIRSPQGEVLGVAVFAQDITHRRQAEEALKQSEARLRTLFEATQDGVWLVGPGGSFLDLNGASARMTGYSIEELKGLRIQDLEAMETPEEIRHRFQRILEQGSDLFETTHRRKDGTLLPVEVSVSVIAGSDQLAVFVRDITERSRAQEGIRRATDLLRHSEALAKVGGWEIDLEANTLFWSDETFRIHDLEPGEHQPSVDTAIAFYAPEWRPVIADAVADAVSTGKAFNLEMELITAKGRRIWVHATSHAQWRDGRVVKVVGAFQDITEQRQAEAALAASEARYRAVVETAADGLVLLDRETARILDANPAFCALYGYSMEELRGMTAMDVSAEPEQTRAATQQGLARVGLRWHRRKDGTVFPVEMVAGFFHEGGQAINVVSIRDITERLAMEQELQRLNQDLEQRVAQRTAELEATNKELEAFAYSVSHDLRAPLRAVAGFATALREDFEDRLDEEGRDYLDRIQAGAVRMGHLIDDLLRLSRAGRGEMIFIPVDLAPMARETLARLQAEDPQRAAEVRVPESMELECDPRLLRILIENLLGNAWKFSSKAPRSSIEVAFTRHDDGTHELVVRDNGVGFPMDRADKLFSPFHRLHSPEEFPGSGIGLAIVQRIAARHGGRTWAESAPGDGATFHVLFAPPPKEAP